MLKKLKNQRKAAHNRLCNHFTGVVVSWTVRTVSSGKSETDQSNVHALVYVIINT
jgi:hypothetical protein